MPANVDSATYEQILDLARKHAEERVLEPNPRIDRDNVRERGDRALEKADRKVIASVFGGRKKGNVIIDRRARLMARNTKRGGESLGD